MWGRLPGHRIRLNQNRNILVKSRSKKKKGISADLYNAHITYSEFYWSQRKRKKEKCIYLLTAELSFYGLLSKMLIDLLQNRNPNHKILILKNMTFSFLSWEDAPIRQCLAAGRDVAGEEGLSNGFIAFLLVSQQELVLFCCLQMSLPGFSMQALSFSPRHWL